MGQQGRLGRQGPRVTKVILARRGQLGRRAPRVTKAILGQLGRLEAVRRVN